jgi:hypothetical protein
MVWLAALLATIAFAAEPANGSITFTTPANSSDGDGPIGATVTFTPVNGGLDITVTNTETGSTDFAKGQAISAFSFTLNNGLKVTAFTELKGISYDPVSGASWTKASGTPFSDNSSSPFNSIDHWGFSVSGANVSIATAGSPVETANPIYMILPVTGTAGGGQSLSNSQFDPYVIGPADFFVTVPGVTTSTDLTNKSSSSTAWDITNVEVGFGTGCDKTLDTTGANNILRSPLGLPEPTAILTWSLLAGVGTAGAALRRRRQVKRVPWCDEDRVAILEVIGRKQE